MKPVPKLSEQGMSNEGKIEIRWTEPMKTFKISRSVQVWPQQKRGRLLAPQSPPEVVVIALEPVTLAERFKPPS